MIRIKKMLLLMMKVKRQGTVNMHNTADDESAKINVTFDDAEKITVY